MILNAYFGRGQCGGGFRLWWRALNGSDKHLDDTHRMRMAGRFSRRLRACAKEHHIPVVYSAPGERKHALASEHLATPETQPGLFRMLVSKAPALVGEAQMTGTGKLGQLGIKQPWPSVNHSSFHILDPDWGHLTIKMSGHPPCGAQGMLHGHAYVACQATKAGVGFTQQDHCFTTVTHRAELAKVADTWSAPRIAERLRPLCERWIYSTCLCFALDLEEQPGSAFPYPYSVYQMEYSRNLLFCSGRHMDQVFQALIDRTRGPLDLDRVRTIFGDQKRPHYDQRKKNPTRWGVVVETPAYAVTICKVHYGKITLQIYTKGERVLRSAVMVHHTREYRWGRWLPCFSDIVTRLRGILERFLTIVGCLHACFVSDETLEQLPEPAPIGQTRVGGIDLHKPRRRRVAQAVLALAASPGGCTTADLVRQIHAMSGPPESAYGVRRAADDIKKLRAKGMVSKIGKSRRYESVPEGLRSLTALLVLREKVIRPLLAASRPPQPPLQPINPTPIDRHYESLRAGMRALFNELGLAA